MKNKRLLRGVLLLQCMLLLSLTSCVRLKPDPKIVEYKNAIWGAVWSTNTKEGEIKLYWPQTGMCSIVLPDGESIDVRVEMSFGASIYLYSIDEFEERKSNGINTLPHPIETWYGKYYSFDEFSIEVVESTYFTVGEKIVFYRVGEIESNGTD